MREQRGGTPDDGGRSARTVDGAEARRAVGVRTGLGGGDPDALRDDVGLHATVEREAARGKRRDATQARVRVHAHRADRKHGLRADAHRGDRAERGRSRDPDDGNRNVLVEAERAARRRPVAVEHDRACSRARGVHDRCLRRLARGDQRGAARDLAEPLVVEERLDVRGRAPRRRKPLERSCDLEAQLVARRHDATERDPPLERELEPCPERDADVSRSSPEVDGAHGERGGRSAWSRDAAVVAQRVARRAEPVVPDRRDHERVEAKRARDRLRERPVRERRVRLRDAHDRDACRVVRDAVPVGIDCALEAGEDLVGARVHRVAAGGRPLPPRDADRQHPGAGRDAREVGRTACPDDDPGELRAVAFELRLVVGVGRREREVAAADDVDAVLDPPAQVRLRTVDAGVEQRHGDAAPVEAGQRDVEPVPASRLEVALAQERRRDGRGEG